MSDKKKVSINSFNVLEKDILKLFTKRSNTKATADNALKNKVIPFNDFEPVLFNSKMWDTFKTEKYGNTYQLYIQSLRICVHLLIMYEISNRKEYFDKAHEIINSWLEYSNKETNNTMVWYDHPTSNRVHVITHFVYLAYKNNVKINEKIIAQSLKHHAEILMSDDNYRMNNHGVMVDRSLLILGNVLSDPYIFNKAYTRIKQNYWSNFSTKGIHLENSPDYHVMVMNIFQGVITYLKKHNISLGKDIENHINQSKYYQNYVLKPNKSFPTIGDTEYRLRNIKKYYNNVYDPEAGICILQSNISKPIYLSFICGYSSKVHKHKDDLSVTLNYNKEDFLIDPGKYNYGNNVTRKYVISKEAHSTFYLKNKDYDIKNENNNIKMKHYYDCKDYVHVVGEHTDYNDTEVSLKRHIIQFKQDLLIIIIDQLDNAVEKHEVVQNFNLPETVNIVSKDNILLLTSHSEKIIMRQENNLSSKIIISDEEQPIAVNSYNFNEISSGKQIQFYRNTDDKNVFLTTIFSSQNVNPSIEIVNDILHVEYQKEYKILI